MKLKDGFVSVIRGAIIGISSTIPGLSVAAVILGIGIYNDICDSISNFFKDIKKNTFVLLPIIIGIVAGFYASYDIMPSLFIDYQEQISLLFIGMIYGEIPFIFKQINKQKCLIGKYILIGIFILPTLSDALSEYNFIIDVNNYFQTVLLGIAFSIGLFVPGFNINIITNAFSTLQFNNIFGNNNFTFVFIFSICLGIILIAKVLNYLFTKYQVITNYLYLGLIITSVVLLFMNISFTLNFTTIFTSMLAFLWGYLLSNKIREE